MMGLHKYVLFAIATVAMTVAIVACSDSDAGPTPTLPGQTVTPTLTAGASTPEPSPTATPTAIATAAPTFPTATVTATATTSPEAIVYTVDDGVPETDHYAVRLGIELAHQYLGRQGGGAVERAVFVRITTTEQCAHGISARGYAICANVDNAAWRGLTFAERVKVAAHEYYHVLQHELGCYEVPQWIFEGSAEFAAFRVMTDAGFLEPQAATVAAIQRVLAVFGSPPALINDVSRRPAGLDEYAYWALAVDQLVLAPGFGSLRNFCADVGAGTSWEQAFLAAFGQTASQFATAFREQSAGWLGP